MSGIFNRPMSEVMADRDALRQAGYCGKVGPFDQETNNKIAAFCPKLAGECDRHSSKESK